MLFNNAAPCSNTDLIERKLGILVFSLVFILYSCVHIDNSFGGDFTFPGILPAFAAVFFMKLLRVIHLSLRRSVIFSLIFALCTPMLPFADNSWGDSTAAAFIIFALYNIMRNEKINLLFAGIFTGLAVSCNYMATLYMAVFTILVFWCSRSKGWPFIPGGAIPLILFICYHRNGLDSIYESTILNNSILPKDISSYTAIQLVFGLLLGSPALLFAFSGFRDNLESFFQGKKPNNKSLLLLTSLAGIICPVIINSGFHNSTPGEFISSRYLITSLPFWIIPAAMANFNGIRRWLLFLLCNWSFINMILFANNLSQTSFNPADLTSSYILIPLLLIALLLSMIIAGILDLKQAALNNDIRIPLDKLTHWIKKQSSLLLLLLFSGLILALLFPGDTVWLGDEPSLIEKAYDSKMASHWATSGLTGTVGITYGPIAVWFYQIILLFSDNPVVMAFIKNITVLGILLYSFIKISRYLHLNWLYGAVLILVSPYLYFYNRMLWDNVLLIPLTALSFAFTVDFLQRKRLLTWCIALLFAYMGLYLHPMSLPWLGAVVLVPFIHARHYLFAKWTRLMTFIVSVLLPALPFAWQILMQYNSGQNGRTGLTPAFLGIITIGRNLTFFGFAKYFIPEYNHFAMLPESLLNAAALISFIFILLTGGYSVCYFLKRRIQKRTIKIREAALACCFTALLLHIVMLLIMRKPPHPHYNNAVTIAMIFIVWVGLERLAQTKILNRLISAILIMQLLLLFNFICYVRIYEGNRRFFYGSTLGNQVQTADTIAKEMSRRKNIKIKTAVPHYRVYPQALSVLIKLRKPYHKKDYNSPLLDEATMLIYYPYQTPSGYITAKIIDQD